jgi:hypothetical protein
MANDDNPKEVAEKRPGAGSTGDRKAPKDTVPEGQGFYAPKEPTGGAIPDSSASEPAFPSDDKGSGE